MGLEGIKISVENHLKVPNKIDVLLKNHLEDAFNPSGADGTSAYNLDITLAKITSSNEIQSNTVNFRTKVILHANFVLKRSIDGKVLIKDKVISMDSFEDSDSPFATLISDEETTTKMSQVLAQEIKLRVIAKIKSGKF